MSSFVNCSLCVLCIHLVVFNSHYPLKIRERERERERGAMINVSINFNKSSDIVFFTIFI